jgi:hypothetical protein
MLNSGHAYPGYPDIQQDIQDILDILSAVSGPVIIMTAFCAVTDGAEQQAGLQLCSKPKP